MNKPLTHAAQKRTLEYLAWISELTVVHNEPPGVAEPIWLILSICLGTREPLLPNLRRLNIEYLAFDRTELEYLIPLLSPSLKVLSIRCTHPPKVRAISTILNFAKASGCSLKNFVYDGCISRQLPEATALFKDLQIVHFPIDGNPLDQQEASITIVKFLTLLPSLRSLTCNLAVFPNSMDDEHQLCHTSLEEITVISPANALCRLFRRCTVFPSVTDVTFLRDGEIPSFEALASSCPNIRRFDLCCTTGRDDGEDLAFKHLVTLLPLPIQIFNLEVEDHKLTQSDIHTLAQSWLDLRSFRFWSLDKLDPLPTLAAFSKSPRLCYLNVDVSFGYLLDNIPKMRELIGTYVATQGHKSPLRSLPFVIQRPTRTLEVTAAEKRLFVECILLLFPNLERFEFLGGYTHPFLSEYELAEFQEILLTMRKEREGN